MRSANVRHLNWHSSITSTEGSDIKTTRDSLSWDSTSPYFNDQGSLSESLETSLQRLLDGPLAPPRTSFPSSTDTNSLLSDKSAHPVLETSSFENFRGRTANTASASESPSIVNPKQYNWVEGKVIKGHEGTVNSISFFMDGTQIASGSSDCTVRMWSMDTGDQKVVWKGHSMKVLAVSFTPDGRQVISGSWDRTLQVWDANPPRRIERVLAGHTDAIEAMAVSPDGLRIASASYDCQLRLWDLISNQHIEWSMGAHRVESIAFSPNGAHLVTAGGIDSTIRIWDATTGKAVAHPIPQQNEFVWCVADSPNGRIIVAGLGSGDVVILDANTREILGKLRGHSKAIRSISFSSDGTRLVSGSKDQSVRIWDVSTGKQLVKLVGHTDEVRSVVFSPDGSRIVSGSADKTIRIWERTECTTNE